jgi:transcriptional regulator with XRE-family HTH domain
MHNFDLENFGNLVRESRTKHGWTQGELADKLGLSRNTVSGWERGEYRPQNLSILNKLARVLQLNEAEWDDLASAAGYRDNSASASKGDKTGYEGISIKTLAYHLEEWKEIHTKIQSLYVHVNPLRKSAYRLEFYLNDEAIRIIETQWLDHCEGQAQDVRKLLQNLHFAKDKLFNDFLNTIYGDIYIPRRIYALNSDNKHAVNELQLALNDFIALLDEILIIVDRSIINIARELKKRQQQ